MLVRFGAAVTLVTLVSLGAIALEKQNLAIKRSISLQHYNLEILQEKRCRLILLTQRLGAPPRLMQQFEEGLQPLQTPVSPAGTAPVAPLLEWRLNSRQ